MDNQLIDLRIELPESSDIVADVAEIVSQSRRLLTPPSTSFCSSGTGSSAKGSPKRN